MRIEGNTCGGDLVRIEIHNDRISSVETLGPADPSELFLSPGFIDIQINGFAGVDFSSPVLTPEAAISVLPSLWRSGVTTFCPTLITNTHEQLLANFRILEQARQRDVRFAQAVPCYHLEGPYISPGPSHGAHDPKHMRAPDWGEFTALQAAAGGHIGIVTLAPELPGAIDFIHQARAAGIIVAISHTDGSLDDVHRAAEAGATLATHLGNGGPVFIDRHRAPFWAQLSDDRLSASIICDGFHLPPEVVQILVRVKGISRTILVTDAIHVAGRPPGPYFSGWHSHRVGAKWPRHSRRVELDGGFFAQHESRRGSVPGFFRSVPSRCSGCCDDQPGNAAQTSRCVLRIATRRTGQPAVVSIRLLSLEVESSWLHGKSVPSRIGSGQQMMGVQIPLFRTGSANVLGGLLGVVSGPIFSTGTLDMLLNGNNIVHTLLPDIVNDGQCFSRKGGRQFSKN